MTSKFKNHLKFWINFAWMKCCNAGLMMFLVPWKAAMIIVIQWCSIKHGPASQLFGFSGNFGFGCLIHLEYQEHIDHVTSHASHCVTTRARNKSSSSLCLQPWAQGRYTSSMSTAGTPQEIILKGNLSFDPYRTCKSCLLVAAIASQADFYCLPKLLARLSV